MPPITLSVGQIYLAVAPGARPDIPIDRHASLEEFERIAPQFPVFRIPRLSRHPHRKAEARSAGLPSSRSVPACAEPIEWRAGVGNAGSISVKLTLLGSEDETLAARELAAPRSTVEPSVRAALEGGLGEADIVGHRIVHGGERFREAVQIDGEVEAELRELVDLVPLHQPKSLAALDAVCAALPDVPAATCFDTAFHATLPRAAHTYALPAEWRQRWRVRRYGFHGLSHAWIARRGPELVAAHRQGCGSSAAISAPARPSARSRTAARSTRRWGFTPLEGLVMATRSGRVDPGL